MPHLAQEHLAQACNLWHKLQNLKQMADQARHDEIPSLHGLCPHETERINMSNFLLYIVKTDISYAQHEYIYGIYLC